jgi:DNA-binding MarR family transcriptional regulator
MVDAVDPALSLRAQVQLFVRRFGLLDDSRTPCGKPLPVSHAHALSVLLERELRSERTHHKDLAAALGLDKSNVARLCARMEDAGHVTQQRSAEDGRAREVALTARGLKLAREVDTASRQRFELVLGAVPAGERRRVLQALQVLNKAVDAIGEGEAGS